MSTYTQNIQFYPFHIHNKVYNKFPIKAEPIGEVINAIRTGLDNWLGESKRKLTERSAKLIYRYSAIDETTAKLKIEINTTEHFNVQPF